MDKRAVIVNLNYFKQGDDLDNYLEDCEGNVVDALKRHSEAMKGVADHLNKLAEMVKGKEVEVEADSHNITIICDVDLAEKLIDSKLADPDEIEEDLKAPIVEEDINFEED